MKSKMILSISLLLLISVTACDNKSKDAEDKMNDQSGMTGMNMGNDTAMMRNMMKDPTMMNSMMTMMIKQCEKDTAMCRNMCTNMMKSPKMKAVMMDMMKKDDMMDMKSGDDMKGMNMDKK